MQILRGAGDFTPSGDGLGAHWIEHLRVADLSVGSYSIPCGGTDDQEPHSEDEVYVVTAGRARLAAAGQTVPVSRGTVLYVPAGETHRFTDVTEDLSLLVLFGPAEYSRGSAG